MSFIGLVTQKEQRNGVYLRAKVIAPNKVISKTADFKVVVEPTEEDDYLACVIDNARARSRINVGAGDISDVSGDLDEYLVKIGLHKTTTDYTFYNMSGNAKFSDYMSSDGKFIGRPKYGENPVSGSLELHTYKKNSEGKVTAEVTTHITLTINPLTADQVLASEEFTKEAIWDRMVYLTGNDRASLSGWERVRDDLNMPVNFESSYTKSADEISVQWSIQDTLTLSNLDLDGSSLTTGWTGNRITHSNGDPKGKIANKLSYTDASTVYKKLVDKSMSNMCTFVKDSVGTNLYYTFKGITITCTLQIKKNGSEIAASKQVTYECAMQSSQLTNSELVAKLYDKLTAQMGESGGSLHFKQSAESTNEQQWSVTGDFDISLMNNCRHVAIPEFQINGSDLYPVVQSITYVLKDKDGVSNYTGTNAVYGYQDNNADYYKYKVTSAQLNDSNNNFAIEATIVVSNYAGGSQAVGKSFLRLKLNKSST